MRNNLILPPYFRPLKRVPAILLTLVGFAALTMFSIIYGYFIAILPPQLLFLPATPILILAGLILWALPDTHRVPAALTVGMLGFFLASNYVWPAYVALNLPGLPWLNPQRIALFLLLLLALYGFATSSTMRRETLTVARAEPALYRTFMVFWGCTFVSLFLAGDLITHSFNKWVNFQIYWTFMFFITAYLCRNAGGFTTLVRALMIAGLITAAISIPEYIMRKVPWVDIVPNVLIGDMEMFEKVKADQARVGLDMYRARSSFGVSISFAEFLAFGLPFFLHAFAEAKALLRKLVLLAAIVLIGVAMIVCTGARSGMIGFTIGVFGYAAYWSYRRWRKSPNDLIGSAAIFSFPVAALGFLGLALTWPRLRVLTFGGGQHSFSNNAREIQWEIARSRLLENPIGHGAGTGGRVIGFRNGQGDITLDSFYITLLMDYGLIGFLAFMTLGIAAIVIGLKLALQSDDPEAQLAGPAAIAIISFLVIKSVLTQSENVPIFFMLVGAICALSYREKRKAAAIAAIPASRAQPVNDQLVPA